MENQNNDDNIDDTNELVISKEQYVKEDSLHHHHTVVNNESEQQQQQQQEQQEQQQQMQHKQHKQHKQQSISNSKTKQLIMATANDAVKAKYATVYSKYYIDPYIGIFYNNYNTTNSLIVSNSNTATTISKINNNNNNNNTTQRKNENSSNNQNYPINTNTLDSIQGIVEEEEEDDDENDSDDEDNKNKTNNFEFDYDRKHPCLNDNNDDDDDDKSLYHYYDNYNSIDTTTNNNTSNDTTINNNNNNNNNNIKQTTWVASSTIVASTIESKSLSISDVQVVSKKNTAPTKQITSVLPIQLPIISPLLPVVPPPPPNTHVIIKRGTYGRVLCIEKSIQSFLDIVVQSSSISKQQQQQPKQQQNVQIIVLGSGYDTTYFRMNYNRNSTTTGSCSTTDKNISLLNIKWYEIDQEEIIHNKIRIIRQQQRQQQQQYTKNRNNNHNNSSNSINLFSSYDVIDCCTSTDTIYKLCHNNNNNDIKTTESISGSSLSESSLSTCYCIGYDLNNDCTYLVDELLVKYTTIDVLVPTLLVFECVQMYMSVITVQQLLKTFNKRFINCSICSYEPIIGTTSTVGLSSKSSESSESSNASKSTTVSAFGTMMEQNFIKAGFLPTPKPSEQAMLKQQQQMTTTTTTTTTTTNDDNNYDNEKVNMMVQYCRTINNYLQFYKSLGYTIGIGCTMYDAYETLLTISQQKHATVCEFLDEYEEFHLIMKHYCIIHVSNNTNNNSTYKHSDTTRITSTTSGSNNTTSSTVGEQYCCYSSSLSSLSSISRSDDNDEKVMTTNKKYSSIDPITGFDLSRCQTI